MREKPRRSAEEALPRERGEIPALIETLLATGRRLEVLTAGEVDTVLGRDGQPFLLRSAQERMRHGEATRQAAILNALRAYVALLDADGRIVSVNEAWRQFGTAGAVYGPGCEVGVNYLETCARAAEPDSGDGGRVSLGIRSVLDGTARAFSIEFSFETAGVPRWFLLTVTPLSEGQAIGAVVMHTDVTEHRGMEDRYRGLLEAAPDAMVVVNEAGEIVLLNVQAERQFGYHRDEMLGQQVKTIIPEGFAERLVADGLRTAAEALAQQIGTGIELTGRRKDRSEFPIELMLSPLRSASGILVTAAIRDITARKRADANLLDKIKELNRSNQELGQFAYIASHDLQEPLRMVASYTQLLSRRYKGKLGPDADEFIAFAVDGATRMQLLIQDLLAYSRVGAKATEAFGVSSEEALQQALANLRGAVEKSGALVTHGPLPTVRADETELVQLFQNLVGNAIKYQKAGVPRIHVSSVRGDGKKWNFAVKDNGLGIDSRYFERIFGMFQRLHKREEFEGTGIGLAICKKIVERHGGVLCVESEPGQGSTFRFDLDAAAPSGRREVPPRHGRAVSPNEK